MGAAGANVRHLEFEFYLQGETEPGSAALPTPVDDPKRTLVMLDRHPNNRQS